MRLYVCMAYLHISISILCFSLEGHGFIEANQQICDFCKKVVFEKEGHNELLSILIFDIGELFIKCNR